MRPIKNWFGGQLPLLLLMVMLVGCEPPRLTPPPPPAPTATNTPATPEPAPQALTGSSWMLVEMNGKNDEAVQGVTAHFGNSQIVGWAGCNSYAAEYQLGAGAVAVTGVLSTTANACEPEATATLEAEYLTTLGGATTYQIMGVDLQLSDAAGVLVLRYRALPAVQLSGATWVLSAYQDSAGQLTPVAPAGSAVTATFDEGVLRGYGGCSNYEGRYTLIGITLTVEEVKRAAVVSTNPACGEGGALRSLEDAYLAALPQAVTALLEGTQLTLKNSQGEPVAVLTFVAAPG